MDDRTSFEMSRSRIPPPFITMRSFLLVVIVLLTTCVCYWAAKRDTIKRNESAAISTLRALSCAQEAFRTAALRDQDNDGLGEYGTLDMLMGREPPMPGADMADILLPMFRTLGIPPESKWAYHYALYLGESACGGLSGVESEERDYFLTAWPKRYGVNAKKSFCVDYSGTVQGSDVGGREATCEDMTGPNQWPIVVEYRPG